MHDINRLLRTTTNLSICYKFIYFILFTEVEFNRWQYFAPSFQVSKFDCFTFDIESVTKVRLDLIARY